MLALALTLAASAAPTVDLYTMGVGDHLYSLYGHAAICVTDDESPQGRCYNYGIGDFSDPVKLFTTFLKNQARFTVQVTPLKQMVDDYRAQDRDMFVQRLPLTDAQTADLIARLKASTQGEAAFYNYHVFADNCTTRIRDPLFAAAGLKPDTSPRPTGRDYALAGFAGRPFHQAGVDLLCGRGIDRPFTAHEAAFHPDELRATVERALVAKPLQVVMREGPRPFGPPTGGRLVTAAIGAVIAAIALALRGARGRVFATAITSALGLFVWSFALYTTHPELRFNEVLLVLLPIDLFLGRRGLSLRLGGLLLVAAFSAAGVLVQPLWGVLLLAGLPLAVAYRLSQRPAPRASAVGAM